MNYGFIITLMSLMLIFVLIFTAFGIPYMQDNFFGVVLTVENSLGEFSNTFHFLYDKIGGFVNKILPSILDGIDYFFGEFIYRFGSGFFDFFETIGTYLKSFDEKFGVFSAIGDAFKITIDVISRVFYYLDVLFKYPSHRSFELLDLNWWRSMFCAVNCVNNDIFYNSDGSFNIERVFNYVDAVFYGEENEYYYQVEEAKKQNLASKDCKPEVTCIIKHCYTNYQQITMYNCDFWFTCPDFSIPSDYLPNFSFSERQSYYYSTVKYLPVYSSNMTIKDLNKNIRLNLCAISIEPANINSYNVNGFLSGNPNSLSVGSNYTIYLHFVKVDMDTYDVHSIDISLAEYCELDKEIGTAPVNRYELLPEVLTRTDKVIYNFVNIYDPGIG